MLCCMWKGIPLIYSGQELPNTRRLRFFDKDAIEWNGTYELHDFYRKLLLLRKNNPALSSAESSECRRLCTNADEYIFSFFRKKGEDEVLVLLNLSNEDKQLIVIKENLYGVFQDVLSYGEIDFSNRKYLHLQPYLPQQCRHNRCGKKYGF